MWIPSSLLKQQFRDHCVQVYAEKIFDIIFRFHFQHSPGDLFRFLMRYRTDNLFYLRENELRWRAGRPAGNCRLRKVCVLPKHREGR